MGWVLVNGREENDPSNGVSLLSLSCRASLVAPFVSKELRLGNSKAPEELAVLFGKGSADISRAGWVKLSI